ncbi:MAG: 3-hydroxyacyl-ACP dehydratase FabZ [Simkaniaceae bacterium]
MNEENLIDIREVLQILPHRYPFLLIDRVVKLDLEKGEIISKKNITYNEHFFQGHFPTAPIMPGVLIIEALAQSGGILIHKKGYSDHLALLLNIKNAKFRRPVVPGDTLYLHAKEIHFSSRAGKISAQGVVRNKVVAEAEIGFALVAQHQI